MKILSDCNGSLWEELPADLTGLETDIYRPLNPMYIVPVPLEYLEAEFGPLTEGISA